MADIKLNQQCAACHGTGIRKYNTSPGGPLIEENPCAECGGDGLSTAPLSLDDTLIQQIITTQTAQQITIDDTYDKVKKIKKTVDDIWDKVNV